MTKLKRKTTWTIRWVATAEIVQETFLAQNTNCLFVATGGVHSHPKSLTLLIISIQKS